MRELISGDSARKLVLRGETEVLLIHHNDTDGLSAAAILVKALERENLKVRRVCLEKPYPEVVTELFEQSTDNNTLVIMVDFGSGMLDLISRLSIKEKRRCIVLDHHAIFGELAPEVHLINPLSMGLKGEDCSASAVAYFFSQSLNKWNEDLASLGVLGALGDGFISHDKLIGLNQNVMSMINSQNCNNNLSLQNDLTKRTQNLQRYPPPRPLTWLALNTFVDQRCS